MRKIKFNAWIPDLGLMLRDVDVCANGMIGMEADEFKKAISLKNESWQIYEDGIYLSDDDHFDKIMSVLCGVLCGDEYYWIEEKECIKLQFTGVTDINKKELFEGCIVKSEFNAIGIIEFGLCHYFIEGYHIKWNDGDITGFKDSAHCDIEKIGNIYENPELIKTEEK